MRCRSEHFIFPSYPRDNFVNYYDMCITPVKITVMISERDPVDMHF